MTTRRSSRPTFGSGIRTAVKRTDQRFLQDVGRNIGAWTTNGTFTEALAFVAGYDAARASSWLPGFHRWLLTSTNRTDGSIAELVLEAASIQDLPPLSPDADARASAGLFSLLDDYLEGKPPR